ncbi:MAG: hypothetical protein WCH57_03390 [Verrucomicrobiota bacterium]
MMDDQWQGLRKSARERLTQRNYQLVPLAERLATCGVEAAELLAADRSTLAACWIPGVEIFPRQVYPQPQRGFFGELARQSQGPLAEIGLWPAQWATATMWAGSGKGFHIHPPCVPAGVAPEAWFRRLYLDEPRAFALRPYDREQWDVMFFLQGSVEMILVDERAGLERRVLRFRLEGDNRRGSNNAGVVIPPGVAHALRAESSEDVIMVYGTSTCFHPAFEGRIESGLETAQLPPEWAAYLAQPHES